MTPEVFGYVTKLSADIFTDPATGVSYYQVELIPLESEMEKLGGQTLLPGMPVEAFIKTDERSPLNYLAKPMTDYFTRAFRES
jgi:HlyD family secretion protein